MPDLNHKDVVPPYLRPNEKRTTSSGDAVLMWHLRIAQPNAKPLASDYSGSLDSLDRFGPLPAEWIHSLEHFLLDHLLATTDSVISVGVMGCRTGLYIVVIEIEHFETMADLVAGALRTVATANAVPHADEVHCGWAAHHSLAGAQLVAAWLLEHRAEWADPGPANEV